MMILSDFVKETVPNWPSNLTLHEFVQHMTLDYEALVRNKVQSEHGYDIFLNPDKEESLREEIYKINDHMKGYFMEMDITEPEVNSLMLGLLWFSVFPCKEFIVGHMDHFRLNLFLLRVNFAETLQVVRIRCALPGSFQPDTHRQRILLFI